MEVHMEHQIPLFDQYLTHLGSSIPTHAVIDLVDVILLTLVLTLIDMGLRLLVECIRFNMEIKRECTIWNLIKTLAGDGWKKVNNKDFLVSKKLRQGTVEKIVKTHLVLFLLAMTAYLIPDRITVVGIKADEFVAYVFMLLPVIFEVSSIIEKIQMIDPNSVKSVSRIIDYINNLRKG